MRHAEPVAHLPTGRIVCSPDILDGKPFIRGTRVPMYVVVDALKDNMTPDQIIDHYPRLTLQDIQYVQEAGTWDDMVFFWDERESLYTLTQVCKAKNE